MTNPVLNANHASLHPLVLHSTKIQLEQKTKILQMPLYQYGSEQGAYAVCSSLSTKSGTTSGAEFVLNAKEINSHMLFI